MATRTVEVEYLARVVERRTVSVQMSDETIAKGDLYDFRAAVESAVEEADDEPPLPDEFRIVSVDGNPF